MSKPLSGVRVLAPEHFMAGPYGSQFMADLGAEIIKVEAPGIGDPFRANGPWFIGRDGRRASGTFLRMNRNKKSLTLDLRKPRGRELFLRLAKISDVVWENFKPGTMDRWGVGYEAVKLVNPSIIYASISGFGQRGKNTSPYIDRPAMDISGQAMSGLMSLVAGGDPPYWLGAPISDQFPGILAMVGVIAALYQRALTGEGRHIDVSMYDASLMLNERAIAFTLMTGQAWHRRMESILVPYGAYQAADGYVVLAPSRAMWAAFCRVLGREDAVDDPRLTGEVERARNEKTLLTPMIEAWTSVRPRAEIVAKMLEAGIPVAPVQSSSEILECPHVKARHMLAEYEDPVAGTVRHVGNPIKMSGVEEEAPRPSPLLGQHTEEILKGLLGLSDGEIEALRADKVV